VGGRAGAESLLPSRGGRLGNHLPFGSRTAGYDKASHHPDRLTAGMLLSFPPDLEATGDLCLIGLQHADSHKEWPDTHGWGCLYKLP